MIRYTTMNQQLTCGFNDTMNIFPNCLAVTQQLVGVHVISSSSPVTLSSSPCVIHKDIFINIKLRCCTYVWVVHLAFVLENGFLRHNGFQFWFHTYSWNTG